MNTRNEDCTMIPVPSDLTKVIGVHDGSRWVRAIDNSTIAIRDGYLTFECEWSFGNKRRITIALEEVRGYQEHA